MYRSDRRIESVRVSREWVERSFSAAVPSTIAVSWVGSGDGDDGEDGGDGDDGGDGGDDGDGDGRAGGGGVYAWC